MKELSLRPYSGRLFVAKTKQDYKKSHKKLFKEPDNLNRTQVGRFSGCAGNDNRWTYLVWGQDIYQLAHELAHVVLHVFEICGIDPRESAGEPLCYMLSQLLMEANSKKP